jgi:hypothetical protein
LLKGSACAEKRFSALLANASSACTPRDQLIDQLSVVLGSRRGCCFGFEAQNNNNNKNNNNRAT